MSPPVTASTSSRSPEKSATQLLAGDTLVYLVLVLLIWGAWQFTKLGLFTAGDDVGYWVGVAGGVMMLLLFSYPMRKYFRFTQNWGRVKGWFVAHMFLGVGGPLLILVHSNFHIGSLNAGVAFYSMLIVAASGVVGRFIFARVNRGLHGEKTDFRELQAKAGLDQEEVRSRLAFAPEVEAQLKAFEESELHAKAGWLTELRRVFWLPLSQWGVYRHCVQGLQEPIRKLAKKDQWTQEDLQRREAKCRKLVRRYLVAVVRVAQYSAYARLFSLWHVAHLPFVYLLIISAVVHVVAVHAY